MINKWRKTEEVLKEFKEEVLVQKKCATTLEDEIMDINPQRIISINDNFDYPEILNGHKMKKLKSSVEVNGWIDKNIDLLSFCLLMLPNGDLLANGNGNHRAVLSKELGLTKVKAYVRRVIYYQCED